MVNTYNIAIVGATGAVGSKLIETLEKRQFPVRNLTLLASSRSAGKILSFKGKDYVVQETKPESFDSIDIAFFSAGGEISSLFAPEAVKRGALVIDNTSHYRMDPEVPLVVPEVNPDDIFLHKGIISNPNCSTIQLMVALKPIHDAYRLKRLIVSTYQAVSGTGIEAIAELRQQNKDLLSGNPITSSVYPHQIAGNVLPQIDVFEENGFTKEEMKMIKETQKIFHDETIQVTATCVRVPVVNGHSESVYIETEKPFTLSGIYASLENAENVAVQDDPSSLLYPLPIHVNGKDQTFVGRIRKDLYHPRGLNLWVVADNLLKGAALNAVQIAETYISRKKAGK